MTEIIKPFGYSSYLELYREIKTKGLAGEKSISLLRVRPVDLIHKETKARRTIERDEEISLDMETIKARAFDETIDILGKVWVLLIPSPEKRQALTDYLEAYNKL